jgi:hypothetical protein
MLLRVSNVNNWTLDMVVEVKGVGGDPFKALANPRLATGSAPVVSGAYTLQD